MTQGFYSADQKKGNITKVRRRVKTEIHLKMI